jgi:hypothetical protein
MLLSNNINISRHEVWLLWSVIVVFIASPCRSAAELQQNSDKSDRADAQYPAEKINQFEGSEAVHFYRNSASDANNDPWRLSDERMNYPVEPVQRLHPLLEIGDSFIGNGPIQPGIKTPAGQMLQPWFLLYGTFRSALQSLEQGDQNTIEWSNRLDLHGNLNFSGTERLLFSMRPLDSQTGGYTGYNFEPNSNDGWREDFNARLTKLYFEGELAELFPGLDPDDSHTYDLGFSIGRQRILLQDGLLMNDLIDMVGITRNSLVFNGVSNLRLTGLYGWNHVNRGNNEIPFKDNYRSVNLFGLLSEADTAWNNTLALDFIYVGGDRDENAWYAGAASTQRFGWLNTTFRVNASIPVHNESPSVGRGVLLLSQLSGTLPRSDNILYCNTFLNIGRFTSAGRSPDQGSPVANLGILYGPVGMGRYGVPLGQPINETIGTAIGYQMFVVGIDSQLIFEVGARTITQSGRDEAALGFGARYQQTIGKHHVLRLDAFVTGQEHEPVSYGLRSELMIKF